MEHLTRAGFDATQGQSLCVVRPPADRPGQKATAAEDLLAKVVFLALLSRDAAPPIATHGGGRLGVSIDEGVDRVLLVEQRLVKKPGVDAGLKSVIYRQVAAWYKWRSLSTHLTRRFDDDTPAPNPLPDPAFRRHDRFGCRQTGRAVHKSARTARSRVATGTGSTGISRARESRTTSKRCGASASAKATSASSAAAR